MRYFIYIAYNGTNYHGWQIQPNAVTVQETVGQAMSVVLGSNVEITGAGRTDTGVHARTMTAHFDLTKRIDEASLVKRINSLLPADIAVYKIVEVIPEAHARFSALSRTYEYLLYFDKNPFLRGLAYRHYRDLDFEKMNIAANKMRDYTDFTSFAKLYLDIYYRGRQVFTRYGQSNRGHTDTCRRGQDYGRRFLPNHRGERPTKSGTIHRCTRFVPDRHTISERNIFIEKDKTHRRKEI